MRGQLSLLGRQPFCPAIHCQVPCGAGIPGLRCTCPPHRCRYCAQTSRPLRSRCVQSADVFRGPLPRPLFTSRSTPTKGASR